MKVAFAFSILFFYFCYGEMKLKILTSIGQILPARQWLFDNSVASAMFLASQLARSGKYTAVLKTSLIKDCESFRTVIVLNSSASLLRFISEEDPPGCTWMIVRDCPPQFVSQLPPLNTLVIFLDDQGGTLTSVHRPCLECHVNIKNMTISGEKVGNLDELTEVLLVNDRDLHGANVNVSVDILRDYCEPPVYDIFSIIQCFQLEALTMVGKVNNFRTSAISPPYPDYPYVLPNGSDGGFLIQLRERSVDVSAAALVITSARLEAVDYVWPILELDAVMFIEDGDHGVRWSSYIDPLGLDVWLAAAACVLLSGALFALASSFDVSGHQGPFGAIYRIFNALQIFCNQGISEVPRAASGRIIHYILLIAAVVLLPAYSGFIISFITVRRKSIPFKTFSEFVNDGRYKILTRKDTFLDYYLLALIPNGTDLAVPLEERSDLEQEGFSKICGKWLSYLVEVEEYSPSIHKYLCDVQELPITVMTEYMGFALPKKSPLKNRLAVGYANIISSGFKNRMQQLILRESKLITTDRAFTAVTSEQTLPIFVLLFGAVLAAFFVLLTEKIVFRHLPKKAPVVVV